MAGSNQPDEIPAAAASLDRLAAASARAARSRGELHAAEQAVTAGVVEFQLARQRAGLVVVAPAVSLSPREREVARLVAAGRTDGEIASELFISKKTASVHVANIKAKLNAGSRVEVAMMAAQLGLGDAAGAATPVGARERASAQAPSLCPYKGLASYDIADGAYFFGRERVVAELVARLAGGTFAAVVGPSGSGKSSIVRAGLVPAVVAGILPGSERWDVRIMRPGPDPVGELGRALAHPASGVGSAGDDPVDGLVGRSHLLLIVDQFEEAFTLCADDEARSAFVARVIALAQDPARRATVVLTLRSDYYGRLASFGDLTDLVGASQVFVGPPSADELARAIEGPTRRAGLRIQPELVNVIIDDIRDRPGALPLLSSALLDLWKRMNGRVLRLADYEQAGGVRGSVARLAESAYGQLAAAEQQAARALLLRLTTIEDGGAAVRRRISIDDLTAEADIDTERVLTVFTEARLLTVDDQSVEVAHEALIDEWPRMRDWLDADAEGRRLRAHLARAADEWVAAGLDPNELYRGARLAAALEWAADHERELGPSELRYLAESRVAHERATQRDRRANRRLRTLLAAAVALLLIAAVAAVVAMLQAQATATQASIAAANERDAASARDVAERAASLARSRELAAAAASVLGEDPALSRLLAVAAADEHPPDVMTAAALHAAWVADRTVGRYEVPDGVPISALNTDIDPGGNLAVMSPAVHGELRQAIRVVDLDGGATVWSHPAPEGTSLGPALFSADGRRVVSGVWWEPEPGGTATPPDALELGLMVWDAGTGNLVDRIPTGPCGARLLDVATRIAVIVQPSRDGLETSGCESDPDDLAVEAVDLATGARWSVGEHTFGDAQLSRDERWVAYTDSSTRSTSQQYVVADLVSGRRDLEIPYDTLPQDDGFIRALNDDGSIVLLGDRPILVADVATGTVTAVLSGGGGESFGVAFAPGGSLAIASGRDAVLRAWDATTGRLRYTVPGAGGGSASVAADGRVLVSDWATNRAVLIEPTVTGELGTVETCDGFVPGGSLKATGSLAVFSIECVEPASPTYVVDLEGPVTRFAKNDSEAQDLALSHDGALLARQESVDHIVGPIRVYDTATGALVSQMSGMCSWDELYAGPRTEAGACAEFPTAPYALWNGQLAFSPDGRFIVAHDAWQPYLAVWDVATGAQVRVLPDLPRVTGILFSPDSDELLVSTVEGELLAIRTDTWTISRRHPVDEAVGGRNSIGFVGYLPDGQSVVAVAGLQGTGGGWLVHIDPETLLLGPGTRIHDASPKAAALSSDGAQVVTGAADGRVRVWDSRTFELLHELRVDGQAQGVAFVGDDRLAVTPQAGDLLIMTLDPDELLDVVRAGITRGFTTEECERFGFGTDCPPLEQLRAGR